MKREWTKTAGFSALTLLLGATSVLPVAAPARAGDERRSEDRDRGGAYSEDKRKAEDHRQRYSDKTGGSDDAGDTRGGREDARSGRDKYNNMSQSLTSG